MGVEPNIVAMLPSDTLMPRRADNLVGSRRRLPIGPGAIGEPAVWDLGTAQHALIAGAAGTGKTMLTNTLVYSAAMRGFRVTVIDLKMGGVDHSWAQHVCDAIATDPIDAVLAMDQARRETDDDRHLVVIDNFETITCPAGHDAGFWDRLLAAVVDLARVGRSLGVHLAVVAQRADNQAVPAELRELLGCRILLGAADPLSVALALRNPQAYTDSAAAGMEPRPPGRGVVEHGTESMLWMQAYRPGPAADLRADLE